MRIEGGVVWCGMQGAGSCTWLPLCAHAGEGQPRPPAAALPSCRVSHAVVHNLKANCAPGTALHLMLQCIHMLLALIYSVTYSASLFCKPDSGWHHMLHAQLLHVC